MELVRYLKIVQKNWWIMVLLVVAAMSSTGVFALQQPAVFESSATLLLNPSVPSDLILYYQSTAAANLADSYTALIHSQTFAESVAKELPFPGGPGAIIGGVTTELVPNTLFYQIHGQSDSPQHAQQLVATLVKVFLSSNATQKQQQQAQQAPDARTTALEALDAQLKKLDTQIQSYEAAIAKLEAEPPSAARDAQLNPLYDRVSALEQTRTTGLIAVANAATASAGVDSAVVVDPAQPGHQLTRKVLPQVLIAGVAALVLGIGLAFMREYLDYTVRSPEYLEETLGLPPMAAIGEIGGVIRRGPGGRRKRKAETARFAASEAGQLTGHNLVTLEHPRSVESEVFRVLRTNIQFASVDKPVRTMVVTSAGPREGKSFTAANLAVVLAQAGQRVILVDTDLRRPSQHKLFNLPNTVGFTNLVLKEGTNRMGALQPVPGVQGLWLITSGPLPPNPSEVLNAHQTSQVMDELARAADIVLYDAPPAGAVIDPIILAARVDATILVINAGVARRDMVLRVKRHLQSVGVRILIPVLNRVKLRDIQGYYYYYYHNDGLIVETPPTNGHHAADAGAVVGATVVATPREDDSRPGNPAG